MIVHRVASRAGFRADRWGKTDVHVGSHLFVGLNAFEPGQEHEPHAHCDREKLYVVLEGRGEITVADRTETVAPGDVAVAPAGVEHSVRNPGPERLVLLVAMAPPPGAG